MNISKENDVIEIEYYLEIVEYFEEEENKINREIFRDKYLAHLMTKLKKDPNTKELVMNSIVIMNVLINDQNPSDRFNNIGISKEELSKKDIKIIKKKLNKLIST